MLGEMVGVLPLIAITATLLTLGATAALRTQLRATKAAAGHHTIDSLLETLREDTRKATGADVVPDTEAASAFRLTLAGGEVHYRFQDDRVTRQASGGAADAGVPGDWHVPGATILAGVESEAVPVVSVRITWRGRTGREADRARRFEADFFVGRGYQP